MASFIHIRQAYGNIYQSLEGLFDMAYACMFRMYGESLYRIVCWYRKRQYCVLQYRM